MHHRARSPKIALLLSSLVPGCIVNTMTQTVSESGAGEEDTDAATDTDAETDTDSDTDSDSETETDSETDTDTDTPPTCGDGVVDEGEDCDDGGESALCNADCTPAACGDGVANAATGEDCDDGGVETPLCDEDCTIPACGDGLANPFNFEQCDGSDLAELTCMSLGFTGGMLACDAGCSLDASGCSNEAPAAPSLSLSFSAVKQFDFSWAPVAEADYYRLEQRATYVSPFVPVSGDIVGTSFSLTVPLHFRHEAGYRLLACNEGGCTSSLPLGVMGSLVEAIGYVKASNTDLGDDFGHDLALSADGSTLVVSSILEDSSAIGIDGNGANNVAASAGAVYVYVRNDLGHWSQQAYVKASNTDAGDAFGTSVTLSADGNVLAVGAPGEDGDATGIDAIQNNDASASGAVYVYVRDDLGQWSQQAYVKASNTDVTDAFGTDVALSADGTTLAVGATGEDGSSVGIDGDQTNNTAPSSGAVYAFVRDDFGQWSQQAYIKASNPETSDAFGVSVALSEDGDVLAVGAMGEDSNATGVGGVQLNNLSTASGAAYVFARDDMGAWSQQAYVKASNTNPSDEFGSRVSLSADASTLAVAAIGEDSAAVGVDGEQHSNGALSSGAVYVFVSDGIGGWSQQAYVKASNAAGGDRFGSSLALDGSGDVLAVGATRENAFVNGINGNQLDGSATDAGAAYVLTRDAMGAWSQRAYVKASNTSSDEFGTGLALSLDGDTLAVSAVEEDSNATGIGGDRTNNSMTSSGAVYLY